MTTLDDVRNALRNADASAKNREQIAWIKAAIHSLLAYLDDDEEPASATSVADEPSAEQLRKWASLLYRGQDALRYNISNDNIEKIGSIIAYLRRQAEKAERGEG